VVYLGGVDLRSLWSLPAAFHKHLLWVSVSLRNLGRTTLPIRSSRRDEPALSFQFEGDLADDGQLDFYEASRFFYGASRFIYTLEHFRNTGVVPARIGRRVEAEFTIAAPQAGSWVTEIMGVAAPIVGAASGAAPFLEIPLKALVSWVFKRLTGGSANQVETILKIERERTKQSQEETRRAELLATPANRLADILEKELERKDDIQKFMMDEIRDARAEAKVNKQLEAEVAPYESQLKKIREKDARELLAKARPQVAEMGLPLKGSASRLLIGGRSADKKVVYVNRRTVDVLEGNKEDAKPTGVTTNVVRFDKESGWGKFRVKEISGQTSFFIPREQREDLKDDVIDAMKQNVVAMTVRFVRDQQRNIKYAKVESIGLIGKTTND
jgi:hypothetical protein